MYRPVLIAVAGSMLISLCAVAQNDATQTQSGSTTPSTSPASSAPAQASSGTQAQPSSGKPASTTPAKHSGKKKHKKNSQYDNPIADVDSKQPDKVLFDRAEEAMKHGKYDVARLSLQTLINTYPDSEYVARAKLAIGDSWYDEGGAAAYAQAESEYKDFITFFPNMPEAAEAQMKIANIHFKEMEKADRDPTHALRAQDEYRQMILQFPDSPLIPQAKERLLEVQEVLAQREYDIGHFYYLRETYPAAIARLKSVTDTYPLYSGASDALFELGNAYEREIEVIRRARFPETVKGQLIKQYTQGAIDAYDRILTRYPLEDRVPDAKKRLEALKQPIPKATPEAVAEDKKEIASRSSMGTISKVMENFHKGPDISEATKVGEPTLVDPKQASAPDMIRQANAAVVSSLKAETGAVTIEKVSEGATPAPNAPTPHSDPTPGTAAPATPGAATDAADASTPSNDTANGPAAGSPMKNDLAPSNTAASPAPPLPPTQVNDLQGATSNASGAQPANSNSSGTQPANASSGTQQQAPPANPDTESSSKKKKKHHIIPF